MANYALSFTVDAPYLLEEGVDVDDFPVIVRIPIANTTNLYDKGETADTIYFESEGVQLKHELIEITATYCTAWVKMDLEADSKKVVTLHYGALVDNNYEDKRAVWTNAAHIYHFNGNSNDTMGIANGTDSAVAYDYAHGMVYKGAYLAAGSYISAVCPERSMPWMIVIFGTVYSGNASYPNYYYSGNWSNKYTDIAFSNGTRTATWTLTQTVPNPQRMSVLYKSVAGDNINLMLNMQDLGTPSYGGTGALTDTLAASTYLVRTQVSSGGYAYLSEHWIFTVHKNYYWLAAMNRLYRNPDAYIEYGTEVDLDALTEFDIDEADCVANVTKQLGIYDVDFRNIMYEVGDYNATWRLPGTEGITIWGIYQPRPVGDYYFPEMDNLGINDALFFTVTDYLVDIHDKIDIEGVRFDLQAIQVHPIADQKIYKMCVLKRQPEYYATCKGSVS